MKLVNTSLVSLYTSSIFVYTKVLVPNFYVIKTQILPKMICTRGVARDFIHVEAQPKIRIKRYTNYVPLVVLI